MSLEIVCGPMFSGKSSYIYSTVKRYASIGRKVVVLKPASDTRYSTLPEVITHDGVSFDCITLMGNLMSVDFEYTNPADVIIIEEAQFFTDLVLFVKCTVENEKKTVIVVGLDGDSDRKPFGQILDCIPLADTVVKLNALCTRCANGTPALFSKRIIDQTGQVCIGGRKEYEPLCRWCYLRA
jgi:thymidine kinase